MAVSREEDQKLIVYELKQHPTRYCSFAPVAATHRSQYHDFAGVPISASWIEHDIRAADEPDELAQLPDFALLGVVPLFSDRAVKALSDLLASNGELLPVRHARQRYFAYNVTTVIDAIDLTRSQVEWFSDGGVMAISSYVFQPELLGAASIFKIPQLPRAFVYVTDEFTDRVRRTELIGFVFSELWRAPIDA